MLLLFFRHRQLNTILIPLIFLQNFHFVPFRALYALLNALFHCCVLNLTYNRQAHLSVLPFTHLPLALCSNLSTLTSCLSNPDQLVKRMSSCITLDHGQIKLTGINLGRVFNYRCMRASAQISTCTSSKQTKLKLKTQPKLVLGFLPLAFTLPDQT